MKKNPMTRAGYDALQDKLNKLKTVDRPAIVKAIATARAHGDLSENAEYSAAKEKQAFIEYQIQLVNQKLHNAQIIDDVDPVSQTVVFGHTVTIQRQDNAQTMVYTIVGEDEADITQNKLSCQSPLAKKLFGKAPQEEITLTTPKGVVIYKIIKIE